ncbi:LPS export ABC transporter periplasmic protein LptC [Limimaricola soesokkakensis]|uniref:LPS export ABC transporter periplasmic protein LptC n=1 Tax=Limimaricola soesokkakensis TaxID=1343159 RepID=UPI003511CB16
MHARDNAYSRFIGWAKVALPLIGLILLSTLFLIARGPSGPSEIPFAEIEAIAAEQRVSAPRFAGRTESGASIAIAADTVRPRETGEGIFAVEAPRGTIEGPGDTRIELSAARGEIETGRNLLRLDGPVSVTSSNGYSVETPTLEADLGTGGLVSTGEISVTAPYGTLSAAAMRTTLPEGGAPRMVFSGGVRLLYDPANQGERR